MKNKKLIIASNGYADFRKGEEKTTLNYLVGNHHYIKGRILMAFDDTGIDLQNPEHKKVVDTLMHVFAVHLYATAHGIKFEDIKF